jgi:hypothetical protein
MAGFAFLYFTTIHHRVCGAPKNPVGNLDLSEKYASGRQPLERKSKCNDG